MLWYYKSTWNQVKHHPLHYKHIKDLEAFEKHFLHSIYYQGKYFITTELFLITLPLSLKKYIE